MPPCLSRTRFTCADFRAHARTFDGTDRHARQSAARRAPISSACAPSDGAQLRAAFWRPEGVPRGTVALVQGRAEFIEKYYEVVGELLERGFVVASFDWRGQGLSQRLPAIAPRAICAARPITGSISTPSSASCWPRIARSPGSRWPIPWARRRCSIIAPPARAPSLSRGSSAPRRWSICMVLPGSRMARRLAAGLGALGLRRLFVPGGGPKTLADKPFARQCPDRRPAPLRPRGGRHPRRAGGRRSAIRPSAGPMPPII